MRYKTVNRGWLKRQVAAGKVIGKCTGHYTDDYAFDAAYNFGRMSEWKPVRLRTADFDHDYENYINLWADDFSNKSGKAYTKDDGVIVYYVHSNLSYELQIVESQPNPEPKPQPEPITVDPKPYQPVVIQPVKMIDVRHLNRFVQNRQFGKLNKLDRISGYYEQIATGHVEIQECKVEYIAQLTDDDYRLFCESLLEDQTWLDGKGGTGSHADVPDVPFWELTEEQRQAFLDASYALTVMVVSPGHDPLYIDPQGHTYARYVGI